MKRTGYSVEQFVATVNEYELVTSAADIIHELGIAEPTFYGEKKQYGGIEASTVRELNPLPRKTRSSTSGWRT